jgi:transposase
MPQKHVVQLGDGDRRHLQSLLRKGRSSARILTHARILLKAADGLSDELVAAQIEVSRSTAYRVRRRFVQQGVHAALHRSAQPARPQQRKLDGDAEAHLIAIACSPPPAGRAHWTLRLLADRLVQLQCVESLSHETVRTTLKKTN